jgi:flagellar assembly protein FliH
MSEVTPILSGTQVAEATPWELPKVGRDKRPANPLQPERPTVEQLQRIEDQARQEGFQQGLDEGRAEARRELERQSTQLAALFDALARPLADVDAGVERELAHLAVVIARQVVRHAVLRAPEALVPLVRELVPMLPASTRQLRIRVHPDEAALLKDALSETDERGWRIEEDATLSRGGCRLESEYSRLDASLEARLEAAIDAALADDAVDNDTQAHP